MCAQLAIARSSPIIYCVQIPWMAYELQGVRSMHQIRPYSGIELTSKAATAQFTLVFTQSKSHVPFSIYISWQVHLRVMHESLHALHQPLSETAHTHHHTKSKRQICGHRRFWKDVHKNTKEYINCVVQGAAIWLCRAKGYYIALVACDETVQKRKDELGSKFYWSFGRASEIRSTNDPLENHVEFGTTITD